MYLSFSFCHIKVQKKIEIFRNILGSKYPNYSRVFTSSFSKNKLLYKRFWEIVCMFNSLNAKVAII